MLSSLFQQDREILLNQSSQYFQRVVAKKGDGLPIRAEHVSCRNLEIRARLQLRENQRQKLLRSRLCGL